MGNYFRMIHFMRADVEVAKRRATLEFDWAINCRSEKAFASIPN
jgi:hypothetical protein